MVTILISKLLYWGTRRDRQFGRPRSMVCIELVTNSSGMCRVITADVQYIFYYNRTIRLTSKSRNCSVTGIGGEKKNISSLVFTAPVPNSELFFDYYRYK